MNWTEITDTLTHLTQPTYLYIGGATLALACFFTLLRRRQPKSVVAYSTDDGRVMVSRTAIVELVRTSCEQLSSVSKPGVKIRVKGRFTHFDITIKLMNGGRLKEIEQTLQAHLREALTENLGIENLGRINIIATGFKSGRIEASSTINSEDHTATLPIEDTSGQPELESSDTVKEELEHKPL